MTDPRADVALLVDFTDLCQSLEGPLSECGPTRTSKPPRAEVAPPGEPAEVAGEAGKVPRPPPRAVARSLVNLAAQLGRVALARAYADWSRVPELASEVASTLLQPVLVPSTEDGEDRSHVRLVVEALESLYAGDEPDAFVLVTSDPTLLPLVHALRADGSQVLLVAPRNGVAEELREASDHFVPLEDVLQGTIVEPIAPRNWRGKRAGGEAGARPSPAAREEARRERPPHPTPVRTEADFEGYDWVPFISLIDDLEHRLPFVGVRYLVNKVLGSHNCGVDDPRLKRDLINRAMEDGLIEMYPVGNVGDRSDPVTACRLDRASEAVVEVLGPTSTPQGPPEVRPEAEEAIS